MSITCEICGKGFKNTQGLRGHKNFVHADTVGGFGQPVTQQAVQQPVSSNLSTRVATEQQVSKLEERLSKLEYITGLRESDWDNLLSDTEPLTNKLNNITEQLSKLSDTVSKLSEAVEVTAVPKAIMDAQVDEFSKRLTDLREAHNRQAAVVNDHRDTFNKNFAILGSRIDKVQNMVGDLGEGLSIIRTTQASHSHDGVSLIPKLGNKLQDLGTKMVELEATVKNAKKRVPVTPYKFRKLKLTDGTEHTYTLYRGQWGLSQPQKIEGGEYIDLAEPED